MPRKTERRHQQGDLSRTRILEAALEIAAERGYDGTSVALVTEKTGLPASSIYWHFKNKDALLAEVLEYSYLAWREIGPTWKTEIDGGSLGDQVKARFRHAATAYTKRPEFWRLGLMLALEKRIKEPAARTRYVQVRNDTVERVTEWWAQLLEREYGPVDPAIPLALGRFHVAAMDGLYVGNLASTSLDTAWLVDAIAAGLTTAAHRKIAEAA